MDEAKFSLEYFLHNVSLRVGVALTLTAEVGCGESSTYAK